MILFFPTLSMFVRRSIGSRLHHGADVDLVARQYGVSVRWLEGQFRCAL